jgi:hypothetical protein
MTRWTIRRMLLLSLSLAACGDDDNTNDPVTGVDARPVTPDAGGVTGDGGTTGDGGLVVDAATGTEVEAGGT